jgi:hypothetical protein
MPTSVIDLIPDAQIAEELRVTPMTLWRYDHDDELISLGWPLPIRVKRRKYRDGAKYAAFKSAMVRRAAGG